MNNNITIGELMKIKPQYIIDIRDYSLYLKGHIENAKSIPKYLLLSNPDKYLDKNHTYYIYCSSGIQSNRVVYELINKGFKVVNIFGGYHNYLLRK
ncbi:MAG: rhodanese-like domain-containing protein [Bacilli bacterium]|nr:rhodanese-like domain-containing protein [Bacilli bacterium]